MPPSTSQEDVFETVAQPLCDHVLNGFNSTCIAYGQTGSGKSHTLFGHGRQEDRGLLARVSEYLFNATAQKHEYKDIGVVVSFMEIYNDRIRDLGKGYVNGDNSTGPRDHAVAGSSCDRPKPIKGLMRPGSAYGRIVNQRFSAPSIGTPGPPYVGRNGLPRRPQSAGASGAVRKVNTKGDMVIPDPSFDSQDLVIQQLENGQIVVKDLSLIPVRSITEMEEVLQKGMQLRAQKEKKLQANGNRSHTIFTINVVQKDKQVPNAEPINGTIHLVDLAGSERGARSKNEGKRFEEAVQITSSLSTLQRVIEGLSTDITNVSRLPYKASKLTRVLQNSLDSKSFVSVIGTINPAMEFYEESLRTLQFVDNCKSADKRSIVQHNDPEKASQDRRICRLLAEISDLKQQVDVAKSTFNTKVDYLCQTVDAEAPPGFFKSTERADFQAEHARIGQEMKRIQKEAEIQVNTHREAAKNAMNQMEKICKAYDKSLYFHKQNQ